MCLSSHCTRILHFFSHCKINWVHIRRKERTWLHKKCVARAVFIYFTTVNAIQSRYTSTGCISYNILQFSSLFIVMQSNKIRLSQMIMGWLMQQKQHTCIHFMYVFRFSVVGLDHDLHIVKFEHLCLCVKCADWSQTRCHYELTQVNLKFYHDAMSSGWQESFRHPSQTSK